jgi:predicted DNA-binding protein
MNRCAETQNLTLRLPKTVLQKAKALAAREGKSLNALVLESLLDHIEQDEGYRAAMERQFTRMEKGLWRSDPHLPYVRREELHDRGL